MYRFLTKNGQTLAFLLGLVITVIMFVSIFGGLDTFSSIPEDDPSRYDVPIFNFGIGISMVLTVLCAAVAVLFGLVQFISNPKGALKGLIGIAVIIALFFIIYNAADPSVPKAGLLEEFSISDDRSKFISGAVATSLILVAVAAVATLISEVVNFFR